MVLRERHHMGGDEKIVEPADRVDRQQQPERPRARRLAQRQPFARRLAGVIAAGLESDRVGPIRPTASAFVARILVFGWISFDQSLLSITVFALVFGSTFLVTAPLTVVFVRENFGTKNLGALAGLITMVHQVFGGVGAYAGAVIFDATGGYEAAFAVLLISAIVALGLTLMLSRAQPRAP